ncbi:peptide chain release factor N(5)-glutamine methyltransferase [Patescibacteria group bacterium]|nr:peptide chain release factor N(5)-glutamine methyltransferase [Patescibacteria group bacterium]
MKNQEIAWLLKEKYHGVESQAFQADCARLESGVPLAYLIGSVPFLDCTIHLDSHPLIPRPETEYWVEQAITTIKSQSSRQDLELTGGRGLASSLHILDLCAGSGAVGIAVAKAIPDANVTFAELDPAHFPTIEKNIKQNTIIYDSEKYKVSGGDLFSEIANGEQFNYILTNPPYIDATANTVDDNVVEHEPHLALFGGVAGMEIITRIITEAPQYLTPLGQLWIEHEPAQVAAIKILANTHDFTAITHPDQYGVPRFSVLTVAQ